MNIVSCNNNVTLIIYLLTCVLIDNETNSLNTKQKVFNWDCVWVNDAYSLQICDQSEI